MQQEDVELEWLRQTEVIYYRLERSHSNALPQLKHNPWSLRCQQQHLQKMKENAKHRNQYSILPPRTGFCFKLSVTTESDIAVKRCLRISKCVGSFTPPAEFILLENLTWRHTMPCVLDLKMGTQQHGDDATEEKKAGKIRKCQQSTASTIGVCLSGMQVAAEASNCICVCMKEI